MSQQITTVRILAAGTYSAAVTEGSGVDIKDFVTPVQVTADIGPSHAGVLPTAAIRLESSGTAAGVYAGVTSSGTFQTANFSGTTTSLLVDTQRYGRYMRAFVALGGTSPKFPISVTLAGIKQSV